MRVVLNLTEPYAHKGYRWFVDNWYTSVTLFLELERRDILACGRKFLPKEIVYQQNEQVKRLKRGDSLFRQSGNLVCCIWKDKKPVHLLSTIPEGLEIGQVEGRLRSEGRQRLLHSQNWSSCTIQIWGGVDLGDQWIATCSRLMKWNIWYYKIFFHMLEVAVLNAHITYHGAGHQGVSLGDFKELLVEQLIGGNSITLNWPGIVWLWVIVQILTKIHPCNVALDLYLRTKRNITEHMSCRVCV